MIQDNQFDDIVFLDYTKKIKSEEFNSLSLEEQNILLKNAIISLSYDFEKLIRIVINSQDNLKDLSEWVDRDLMYTSNKINDMSIKMEEHINSVHSCLIIGKENKDNK